MLFKKSLKDKIKNMENNNELIKVNLNDKEKNIFLNNAKKSIEECLFPEVKIRIKKYIQEISEKESFYFFKNKNNEYLIFKENMENESFILFCNNKGEVNKEKTLITEESVYPNHYQYEISNYNTYTKENYIIQRRDFKNYKVSIETTNDNKNNIQKNIKIFSKKDKIQIKLNNNLKNNKIVIINDRDYNFSYINDTINIFINNKNIKELVSFNFNNFYLKYNNMNDDIKNKKQLIESLEILKIKDDLSNSTIKTIINLFNKKDEINKDFKMILESLSTIRNLNNYDNIYRKISILIKKIENKKILRGNDVKNKQC